MALTTPSETTAITDWGPFSLRGKNALITGAAMGIGYGIAQRFIEAGANVVLADVSPTTEAAAASLGPESRAIAFKLDVTDEAACAAAVDRCVSAFGSLDILVNDAGIYPTSPILEMTPEFFDRVLAVNLKGLVFMCKAAGRQMVQQGRIVNVASIDAVHPSSVGLGAYDASKGGVVMFAKSLALELAPHGVLVNTIDPGGITTEGTTKSLTGLSTEQTQAMLQAFARKIPLGHLGQPDDIAGVAVFLASQASGYMTGSVVVVDGGYLLA